MKTPNTRLLLPNVPSRSARQLIASAAANAVGVPVNKPYRPVTATARRVV
jgi:hypothetical protein